MMQGSPRRIFSMNLKIGDRVKINNKFPNPPDVGRICIVTEIEPVYSIFACQVREEGGCWDCPVYGYEIEDVSTKGQQLLFSFMEQ